MLTSAISFLASVATHPVPETGMTAALVTGTVITLGLFARFVKNRKK